MDKIKNYFKRLWNALWASTDIDEKAEAALKEAKARLDAVRKELVDVKNAAIGKKKRTGKKPYYKNKKKKNNNNTKK